ncbi:secreted frizzled-related protein 2-like isoform X3 [Bufo gargarizans]|uniref:secreted frizzled-related protein 2-like isoform X3 n=1 Tax=Bufo gargarizans TaxID=30331 RepID=UPI001CF4D78F|nr:secreted frizzled-related protein 2-like isoform X3 [Bufo gargarizans]XP_044142816.1 secreted frizzled-related protein 2-like isoform X3 [Bufo gargarizans]XP_044142817.1 secreted frizzled-related protein 2-like isoform X3 [Bufo gargarizans]XP_044142818.1 secreted frizzled-related protein 2-like isoform X3 [Bufo gargarizans]
MAGFPVICRAVTMRVLLTFGVLMGALGLLHPVSGFPFILTQLSTRKSSCKAIPSSMTLCHGVGYSEMRLPNLLGHDTMKEVLQQAGSWVPLLTKQCHGDTKKFLCSLFAPVCLSDLEEAIHPCRSLCEEVRDGCTPVMAAFGFPWPDMFNCSQFPEGNELCVPPAGQDDKFPLVKEELPCPACHSASDSEKEFLQDFCSRDFAMKVTIRSASSVDGDVIVIPEARSRTVYKAKGWTEEELKKTTLWLTDGDSCICPDLQEPGAVVLVMGHRADDRLAISWVRKWQKSEKEMKKFSRTVRKLQC